LTKSYPASVDDIDKAILKILLRNSRTPYRKIAEQLDVSESTVYLRIRKLSELGVLKGFTVNIDLSRLGYNVIAFIMLKIPPRNYEETVGKVINVPGVVEAYEVSGDYQLLIKVRGQDNKQLARVIDEIGRVGDVIEVKVLYVIRTLQTPFESAGTIL